MVPKPPHDVKYWAAVTRGMDFRAEDRFDYPTYNRVLWEGMMGDAPTTISTVGMDLRQHRDKLLADYMRSR